MAASAAEPALRIHEIYRSIQGESTFAGRPCVFVRTTGCDIRCVWCDEPEAFTGGERVSVAEILERVRRLDTRLVELTGGEPLLQPEAKRLVAALCADGYEVLIETGGHRDISGLDPRCTVILDLKAPGSGVAHTTDLANLARLRARDEVKVVLADRADYEWARDLVRARGLERERPVHFSPVHGKLDPAELSAWILEDGLGVRLNLQLHKYVWGAETKGV